MRNLLAFVAAAAITFVGLGYYLGWYTVRSEASAYGHRTVNIDVNTPKVLDDVHKGVQKGEAKLDQVLQGKSQKTATAGPSLDIPPPSSAQTPH